MKRILFVDDEPALIEGLRGRLRRAHKDWDMCFVSSGMAAIEQCEQKPFDVVVTDIRMPQMDGGRLLQILAERWPQTIRIVLSGYSDEEQVTRLVPLAHQYLSKPCEPERLQSVIQRCCQLRDTLQGAHLQSLIGRIRRLPAVPRTYAKLRSLLSQSNTTAKDIAKVVATDPVIAARVLQVVNSAFFRLARRMNRIEDAVTYLGFSAIQHLVMSAEIFSEWRGGRIAGIDPDMLQKHSQTVAAAAYALTKGTKFADDALLAGLLHDIGYLVLMAECPQELQRAAEIAQTRGVPMYVAEKEVLGASHAELGAYLLGLWGLPYPVIEAVAHHHEPGSVVQTEFDLLAALVVAQTLAQTDGDASISGTPVESAAVDAEYLRRLNAPLTWDDAKERVERVKAEECNS